MKAVSVLGTSSNSGKSWLATALCRWLCARGVAVAPFKSQNMSNNSFATWDGAEIGRAQAVQAEACGLLPSWQMNPILLKPSGKRGSQVLVRGRAVGHLSSQEYFSDIENYWQVASETLNVWGAQWEALVLEGAGSPVELNLMDRDIANLRPVRHLDGRWILCADIERGGVFAQIIGTWKLLPQDIRERCLGVVVNKFRGDLALFSDARDYLNGHVEAPLLGVVPFRDDLQPEPEDSLSLKPVAGDADGRVIAWLKLPYLSNATDADPWREDRGVQLRWMESPSELAGVDVAAIVIPGSKDTLSDLRWLEQRGWGDVIRGGGVPVVGICGGFQMLGQHLEDPAGVAGRAGETAGLGCLPMRTVFEPEKLVRQVDVRWPGSDARWQAYEIHMGRTEFVETVEPLLELDDGESEGVRQGHVWGTYTHGLFDHPQARSALAALAGITDHIPSKTSWADTKGRLYDAMADCLDEHLKMDSLHEYLGIDR